MLMIESTKYNYDQLLGFLKLILGMCCYHLDVTLLHNRLVLLLILLSATFSVVFRGEPRELCLIFIVVI